MGWHLGHIAYTEALWILKEEREDYKVLFSADGLPKAERQNLPALNELLDYLASVRERSAARFEQYSPRLLYWLLQHEGQHAETMAMVMAMHEPDSLGVLRQLPSVGGDISMVRVEGGFFWQGEESERAIDNEKPPYRASVEAFCIDRYPVTCGAFAQFIEAGGYRRREWWSAAGWRWLKAARVSAPLYWSGEAAFADRPVCGVSAHEAAAFARSRGKRLPTESEWERAAESGLCEDLFGSVWEWTATAFEGYEGFKPFPYAGYSQAYFDGEHRVLKGGSWASPQEIIRKSFRNWYHPHRRELFAGFRCVR